ncbi:unnamed protein product [Effrenium voratum]|nr:unnamed protein product [Effrenium voratum]
MEIRTCSWKGSMSTSMRQLVAATCPGLCSWTWSRGPWTACAQGPSVSSSGRTTSSSDRPGLATTGRRATIQKGPSSSTQCSTWFAARAIQGWVRPNIMWAPFPSPV